MLCINLQGKKNESTATQGCHGDDRTTPLNHLSVHEVQQVPEINQTGRKVCWLDWGGSDEMDQDKTGSLKSSFYFLLNQIIFPELILLKICCLHGTQKQH